VSKTYYRNDGYINRQKGILLVYAVDEKGYTMAIYTAYPRRNGFDLYIRKPINGRTAPPKVQISFRELCSKERIEQYVNEAKAAVEAAQREKIEAEGRERADRMANAINKYGMLGVRR
jgi:hypothetical protein